MKPLLRLKTVLLLVYVALCMQLVLSAYEAEPAAATVPHTAGE